MASSPTKKKSPKFPKAPVPEKKGKKTSDKWRTPEWVTIGCDTSMSTISLGGLALTKDGKRRSGSASVRWPKGSDFHDRMVAAAKAHAIVFDLFEDMKLMPDLHVVYLAVEEAVPMGFFQRSSKNQQGGMAGAFIKQQTQISGAFIGGLLRWGWKNIYEIQANQWRKLIADDIAEKHGIDFTTHKTKFGNAAIHPLPKDMHVKADAVGKYRAAQWVREFHPKWDKGWEDVVVTSHGQQLRGDSKAVGIQCNDIYEALVMAEWMRRERKNAG